MPTPHWKGSITFGLVNIPILFLNSEDNTQKTIFHQIDKSNHARIKYKRVNSETGKEVPWNNIVKGYEYSKDKIFIVDEGDLDYIAGENVRAINIDGFINADDINFVDILKTYYLVPDKKGEKGYVILREALSKSKKFGIAKVVISTKEYVAAVGTYKNALVLYLLHYHDEIIPLSELDLPSNDFKKYKVTPKEINIANQLIKSMTEKWKPENYKDTYKETVSKWAEKKAKNLPLELKKQSSKHIMNKNISFVDLLKKSLSTSKGNSKKRKGKKSIISHAKKQPASRHVTHH